MTEKLSIKQFDENYQDILTRVQNAALQSGRTPEDITLLAATKTVDINTINHAIESGISFIGENRVQEFLSKEADLLPVHRHFIGHLQTNKVKDIIQKVELIHSVDSFHLAKEISRQAEKAGVDMDILLEVNIGNEESKSGFAPDALEERLCEIVQLPHIHVKGLMAIPPICNQPEDNRKYFKEMYHLFLDIRNKKIDNSAMSVLSMGMSDDFEVAIQEGATLVRVGTALFGKRVYH
ncbi:MAG: YggS family pyridoxal phosphate-dependent enzyme [Clostridia bacterium]|nr:YggS family pyridoxal phosphate-dependent enzyme [Clostridia bacterium]